jgi:hypothetical protein
MSLREEHWNSQRRVVGKVLQSWARLSLAALQSLAESCSLLQSYFGSC